MHQLGRPLVVGREMPTAAEIVAAARAAREAGAVGISCFDWARATPAHWDAHGPPG
jgi:hypothetical protein